MPVKVRIPGTPGISKFSLPKSMKHTVGRITLNYNVIRSRVIYDVYALLHYFELLGPLPDSKRPVNVSFISTIE